MHKTEDTPVIQTLKNDVEAARFYGVKVSTMRKWRFLGIGPKFVKLGTLVRYRDEDLRAFLEACPTGGGQLSADESKAAA